MGKKDDIEDLLGSTKAPAKKAAVKKAAPATEAPAAPAAKKAAAKLADGAAKATKTEPKVKAAAEPKAKAAKEPVHFAPGERQELYDKIAAKFKPAKAKPMNSKDLAAELEVPTRKLRPVLYAMAKKADALITLELSSSKVLGMTVSRA